MVETLDRLERMIKENIRGMGEALANGAAKNHEQYCLYVGRVEGWNHVLADIHDIRQQYIDE